MNTLPDHLRAATAARTEQATAKATAAIRKLASAHQPISFTAVARHAGVSTDFLYRHTHLRAEIERHREKHSHRHRPPRPEPEERSSSAVRALSRKLREQRRAHHQEVSELRKALAVAQGDNLELRRRLSEYEPQ